MEEKGASYLSALKEAQYLGYAEPDPNRDVAGLDTAAKLLILANSFLGGIFDWTGITIQGIDRLADGELRQASERKSTIKLLGKAKIDDTGEWHLSVAPEWIPVGHPLARLKGTQKGIYVETSAGGCYALLGGASGAEPTATSMFRELQEILTI
jgi:homoserine dehydrogenase